MLNFLPSKIKGIIGILLFSLNTVFWVTLLLTVSAIRIILPIKFWYYITSRISIIIANCWITGNNITMALLHRIEWDLEITGDMKMDDWYLVISNHQTWNDIIVLQKIFLHKIPFLKFFIKQKLMWVPFLGQAWMALEFPFMKRYSKEFIEKNPHLKGKDIESTKKACEKFRTMPTSIMNFTEGTRFTSSKHKRQQSPYMHLLKPKAGGISLVMGSMGDILHKIVDVTIFYPDGATSLWEFICGKTKKIVVKVNVIPISDKIRGDYVNDPEFAAEFQNWLNNFWKDKDLLFSDLQKKYGNS